MIKSMLKIVLQYSIWAALFLVGEKVLLFLLVLPLYVNDSLPPFVYKYGLSIMIPLSGVMLGIIGNRFLLKKSSIKAAYLSIGIWWLISLICVSVCDYNHVQVPFLSQISLFLFSSDPQKIALPLTLTFLDTTSHLLIGVMSLFFIFTSFLLNRFKVKA